MFCHGLLPAKVSGDPENIYGSPNERRDSSQDAWADMGLRKVVAYVKGPGSGREAAIRALAMSGIEVSLIKDTTPIPHNGCRPPKRRRV